MNIEIIFNCLLESGTADKINESDESSLRQRRKSGRSLRKTDNDLWFHFNDFLITLELWTVIIMALKSVFAVPRYQLSRDGCLSYFGWPFSEVTMWVVSLGYEKAFSDIFKPPKDLLDSFGVLSDPVGTL